MVIFPPWELPHVQSLPEAGRASSDYEQRP